MSMYDITPEEMRNIATKIDGLASDYQGIYNNNLFQSLIGGELKDAYKGTDADTLVSRLENYRIPFNAMKQQLNNYAEFLRATALAYEEEINRLATEAANVGK